MTYPTMLHRLVANTAEPDNDCACWTWTGATRRHGGGHRPSLSRRVPDRPHPVNANAARVMLEQFQTLPPEANASHLCEGNWLCVNPDHLVGESFADNIRRRDGHVVPLPSEAKAPDDLGPWWVGTPATECPF